MTNKKKILFVSIFAILALGAFITFSSGDDVATDDESTRDLASTSVYEQMGACAKQDELWSRIKKTEYKSLPDYKKFGPPELWKMSRQAVGHKGRHFSDFANPGWVKFLHARGVIAKVKIVPRAGNYTGIFQGADCALLRLSLTFKPGLLTGVAPGLALKVLRDHANSANVSALVSLQGQDKNYNFFQNPMSNIVPVGSGLGAKIVHNIFSSATKYPEELMVEDMAKTDARGRRAQPIVSPRQLFFVPGPGLTQSTEEHDVRTDIMKIPANTVVYRLMAAPEKRNAYDYSKYTLEDIQPFVNESLHIADIVTTSEFAASSFGDGGIFFRHQIR